MSDNNKDNLKQITMKDLMYDDPLVFDKVVQMIKTKRTYDFIIEYLNTKGYKYSKVSLVNFKKKVNQSIEEGIPLESLVDHNSKKRVTNVPSNRVHGYSPTKESPTQSYNQAVSLREQGNAVPKTKKVYSIPQALESIIQKGMDVINETEMVDANTMLRSMELLSKYYPNNNGLTQSALEQYQLIMHAQLLAVKDVLVSYVKEEDIPQALEDMDNATNKYLDALGADEEGKALLDALTKANKNI